MSYQNQDRDQERRSYEEWHRYGNDRGFFDRATDEIRSWFGDEDAERRRQEDQQMRMRGSNGGSEHRQQRGSSMDAQYIPEWQRRDYSGPSPRGSNFEEHGRYDGPSIGGRSQRMGYNQSMGYGEQRYNSYSRGQREPWQYEGDRADEMRYSSMGFGSSDGNRGRQPRFFDEDRDFENRMPMGGERWGGITPAERSWNTEGRHRGRGPRNYQRSDERISDEIHQILTFHPELDASDVDIIVESAIVTLRGAVDSRAAKRLTEDLVEDVFGVKEVHNELRVNRGDFQKPLLQPERDRMTPGNRNLI